MIIVPKIKEVTVRQEKDMVMLISNGKAILLMPYDGALKLSKALTIQAKKAEEFAKRENIIYDQAVLLRSGFPLGLTKEKWMIKEAGKVASTDTKLRRYMPSGVKSQEAFGVPKLIMHKPKEDK